MLSDLETHLGCRVTHEATELLTKCTGISLLRLRLVGVAIAVYLRLLRLRYGGRRRTHLWYLADMLRYWVVEGRGVRWYKRSSLHFGGERA